MLPSDLIAAARKDEPGAVDRLFALYRNYLRLIAYATFDARLRAKADPSDAVQMTLLRAHERFAQFRGTEEPELTAWLRRILANCLTDLDRQYRQVLGRDFRRERSLEEALDRSSNVLGGLLASEGSSPSRRAERREQAVALADAMAELDPQDRELILLRSFQAWSWAEIGNHTKRTADAARVQWGRALKRLGQVLEERP